MIPWFSRKTEVAEDRSPAPPDEVAHASPGRSWLRRPSWRAIAKTTMFALLGLLLAAVGWASWVAPPWGPMEPPEQPTFIFLGADGVPIARRGARDAPVVASRLPLRVRGAFIAIEDRRFADHFGIDPRGLIRASWRNFRAGGVVEGGSTITQQLAKNAFLSSDRKYARKLQEVILAIWLDAWLSKDEILSRYLSSIYFGDGAYGLRAAARHYFQRAPEDLSVAQAAMLAGMVKAPSRLNPTVDLPAAQARSRLVLAAMAEEGMITAAELPGIRPAVPRLAPDELPAGTYFVDWVAEQAAAAAGERGGQIEVRTTLDPRLQKAAIKALTSVLTSYGAPVHATQAALVAMTPDGRVVAMVGGRSYKASPYNRATQAKRQPGSAFKLIVYLAALEHGYTPETPVGNGPLTIDGWSPSNYGGRFGGPMPLRSAFQWSSNVAAVRVAEDIGRDAVADTARRLGIESRLTVGPSIALGTSGMTLIELTAAYAAVAGGHYPVEPRGLAGPAGERERGGNLSPEVREAMLDLLWTATNQGTGRAAALAIPSFGKTGTTQNYRDAVYVGFAGGLVTGVWVGNDDDAPMLGVTGGSLPATIWKSFMSQADLRAEDLRLPPRLELAIEQRMEAMRQAEEQRQIDALLTEIGELEAEEQAGMSPLERFFEPLIPRFLRRDRDGAAEPGPADEDVFGNAGAPSFEERRGELERRRDELRLRREQRLRDAEPVAPEP